MKKNLYAMLLVLAVGSVANVQAGCSSCKKTTVEYSSDKVSSDRVVSIDSFNAQRDHLASCIKNVKEDAQHHSKQFSFDKLDEIEGKINTLDKASLPPADKKIDLRAKHIRTLKDKLEKARHHVRKYGKN